MTQILDRGSGRADAAPAAGNGALVAAYDRVRAQTERLCEPLVPEDYVIQPMPDASPTKWHLAHTTWFFEQFLLAPHHRGYRVFHPRYAYLFNSYYNTIGERHCRPKRGLLSRPTVEEVYEYRRHVDTHMRALLGGLDARRAAELRPVIEIGLNHEQQHQELMLTDLKYTFAVNPLYPVYRERPAAGERAPVWPMRWVRFPEGLHRIGHEGDAFAYDNEQPRHRVFVDAFELGSRLVTNGEYKAFIADGGYRRAELWLSEGWNAVQSRSWDCPLYWEPQGDRGWRMFTLAGVREVEDDEPVCHVSYFEADAYARWAGGRLATEAEWEVASESVTAEGNFVDDGLNHPAPAGPPASAAAGGASDHLSQMFGDAWEWTRSQYLPYPGYVAPPGALGEYNGKFMCNQFVLRGGSCATPASHVRRTYRNFFPPDARWQFTGIRLARDCR